jgi:hypothetical protein
MTANQPRATPQLGLIGAAVAKQQELGRSDQGERAGVTSGKNMDGFLTMIQDVIICRKLTQERLYTTATVKASPRTAAEAARE